MIQIRMTLEVAIMGLSLKDGILQNVMGTSGEQDWLRTVVMLIPSEFTMKKGTQLHTTRPAQYMLSGKPFAVHRTSYLLGNWSIKYH